MESKLRSPIFAALRRSPNHYNTRTNIWPIWVAAFTMLALLGIGSVGAAPVAKSTTKNKANHARSTAPGTRLFATGAVDPATSTVKAITADNRFTWIHLPADALIVQGGKNTTADAIGEGNKLSCQGKWVDDAWGPVFQAKRVEILGNIGDESLREKVAAACQAIQGTSQSASAARSDAYNDAAASVSSSDNTTATLNAETASLNAETDELKAYNDASNARQEVASRAFDEMNRLADAAESNPTMRHRPAALKAMRDAVVKYKQALDAEDAVAPVPPLLRVAEEFDRRANQQQKVYADLRLQYFGLKSHQGWELMRQALGRSDALIDEAKAALDNE